MSWLTQLRTRPRLIAAVLSGLAAAWLLPDAMPPAQRAVLAWNAAIWLYLLLVWVDMTQLDHGRLRQRAVDHADGARVVLAIAVVSSIACLAAVVTELAAARVAHEVHGLRHVGLALVTLVGSWLLVPTEFALAYASRYYAAGGHGVDFPGTAKPHEPNYVDFMYFDEPAHRLRVDAVLGGQHARGQRLRVVVGQHGHHRLHHDRAVVELAA
jgi:uncharacterized membrane protein